MNFFKKVITFFSAIWNAILWRKSVKKAKQAAKSDESAGQAENSLNPVSETEKMFVDIPLTPEINNSLEQELLVRDEVHAAFTPIPELHIGPPDTGIRKYSSGIQLFVFEEDTAPTLSFFSEPIRDDSEIPLLTPIVEKDIHDPDKDESAVSEIAATEVKTTREDEVTEVFGLPEPEELPTPPNDPVPEEAAGVLDTPSDDEPDATNAKTAECATDDHKLVPEDLPSLGTENQNDETELKTLHPSNEDASSSTHHFTSFKTRKISSDLNYLAIGDDTHPFDRDGVGMHLFDHESADMHQFDYEGVGMHLFDHEGVADLPEFDESVKNENIPEPSQPETKDKLGHDVSANPGTEASMEAECNQSTGSASENMRSIGVSVSTQAIPNAQELLKENISSYSTNYMVKSDSLVNFFPDVGIDLDETSNPGLANVLIEAAKKSMTLEEEKETAIPLDHNVSVLKEGGLEEIMCTPKGILKLSGDHHVDRDEEVAAVDISENYNDVKTAVDDFLMEAFAFEEPLLSTHLEGNMMEETPNQRDMIDDPPIIQELLENVGTVSFDGLDSMSSIETDTIGRCRSVIMESPISPTLHSRRVVSRNGSPNVGENDENRKSTCKLSQFTTFHLDDEPKCVGHLKNNDLLAPGMATVRRREMPVSSALPEFVPAERDGNADQVTEEDSAMRFLADPQNNIELFNWPVTIPLTELEEVIENEACPSFLNEHASPMLLLNEKGKRNTKMGETAHEQDSENVNDFYPFIDCSSYLFRIPEEIRKETSFNPCVGAAPRRSSFTKNVNPESGRYEDDQQQFVNKYSTMNSMVPTCVSAVPLINTCIPEEYKSTRIEKLSDGYRHIPHEVGTFWGSHGMDHAGEQQQAMVGYPVSCDENYYEDEELNAMPTTAYESDQANLCSNQEGYGYINPYGAVEFPMLSIPLCTPQSQSPFIPRGSMAPLVFPIGPLNASENGNMMNLQEAAQNERFSIPHPWVGYPMNSQLQNDDEEREIASLPGGITPIENLSCTGTNEDDDDLDNNPIPDHYLQLAENNSLHTVKSKADSYSGSLFCESLRSLISHNTENENIFPSFSCSSVQGCCPSIVLQCETTASNDSLPSIIVEETNYSRSVDEDYLATEKFMNDVNTALNESVLDQIHGQVDLHSNLLGRGDGSMSIGPGHSGNEDHVETPLGENISINNSKLTLLDGVLGSDGGNEPERNSSCELEVDSSNSTFFREVVNTIVEGVIVNSTDGSTPDLGMGPSERSADCRDHPDESGNLSQDRHLVVQNMMFIEGMVVQLRQDWPERTENKLEPAENKEKCLIFDKMDVNDSETNAEEALEGAVDNKKAFGVDDGSNRRGRRNRRRRKKLSDFDLENEPEPCTEVPGTSIGDSAEKNNLERNRRKTLELPCSSDTVRTFAEAQPATPKADGEHFTNEEESPSCEHDSQQMEDEGEGHPEEGDEPGENSGNPSGNRRRRNRRRKRKN